MSGTEAPYYETLTSAGTVQWVVWVQDDDMTFPVAHRTEAEALATLNALAADPDRRAVPMPD